MFLAIVKALAPMNLSGQLGHGKPRPYIPRLHAWVDPGFGKGGRVHCVDVGPGALRGCGAGCTAWMWGRVHCVDVGPGALRGCGAGCTAWMWGRVHCVDVGPGALRGCGAGCTAWMWGRVHCVDVCISTRRVSSATFTS